MHYCPESDVLYRTYSVPITDNHTWFDLYTLRATKATMGAGVSSGVSRSFLFMTAMLNQGCELLSHPMTYDSWRVQLSDEGNCHSRVTCNLLHDQDSRGHL